MWSCVKLRWFLMWHTRVCVCAQDWVGVCPCTLWRSTEASLWSASVPQGAGIWHIVSVGNSNYLQLSTCFDPFRNFHFLRSLFPALLLLPLFGGSGGDFGEAFGDGKDSLCAQCELKDSLPPRLAPYLPSRPGFSPGSAFAEVILRCCKLSATLVWRRRVVEKQTSRFTLNLCLIDKSWPYCYCKRRGVMLGWVSGAVLIALHQEGCRLHSQPGALWVDLVSFVWELF